VNERCNTAQTGKRHAVRVLFWLHASVATYCVSLAVLDASRRLPEWLSPNVTLFYALLCSAGLFLLAVALTVRGSGIPYRGALEFTHVLMSFAQILGLFLACS